MSYIKFLGIILLCAYSAHGAIELCATDAIAHCSSVGFARCNKIATVDSCYCAHTKQWSNITDILQHAKECDASKSVYLDAHYWFQDLPAATLAFSILFGIISILYLVVISAKVCAIHQTTSPNAYVSYWPPFLSCGSHHRYATIIPASGRKAQYNA